VTADAPPPPGIDGATVKIDYPVDALVSYHFFRDDKVMDEITAPGHLRLIGDSGAFSAHTAGAQITLGEYAAWCRRWESHLVWRASLDVIGDPIASLANWRALRDVHGLHTVPTIHVGTDPSWIGAYATQGVDFIGLGGMVGRSVRTMMRWSIAMFQHARTHYPHVRFHAWGQAGRRYLDALPVYSADSSRSAVAYRYGLLRLFDPASGRPDEFKLDGGPAVLRQGRLLRETYGVDPNLILTSHRGNRRLLIRLAVAGTQQYARWLRHRHGDVAAPAYAMNPAQAHPAGPLIHHVSVVPHDYRHLKPITAPEDPA
jgi:hypothetical protein